MRRLYFDIGSAVSFVAAVSILVAMVQLMQKIDPIFYSVTAALCMIFTFIVLVVTGFQLLLITDR